MAFKASKCPTDELSLSNCAIVNPGEFPDEVKHIEVHTGGNQRFIFSIKSHPEIQKRNVGFSLPQRKWAVLSLNQDIDVKPYTFGNADCLSALILEADFMQKKTTTQEPYDTELMAQEFVIQFPNQAFTVGQQLAFSFANKKLLLLVVKDAEAADIDAIRKGQEAKPRKTKVGRLLPNTVVQFEKAENSSLNLTGKAKGQVNYNNNINQH